MSVGAASKGLGLVAILVALSSLVATYLDQPAFGVAPALAVAGVLCGAGLVARGFGLGKVACGAGAVAVLLALSALAVALAFGSSPASNWLESFFHLAPVDHLHLLVCVVLACGAASVVLGADSGVRPGLAIAGLACGYAALATGALGLLRAAMHWGGLSFWETGSSLGPAISLLLVVFGLAAAIEGRSAAWHLQRAWGAGVPALLGGLAAALTLFLLFSQQESALNLEYAQTRALEGVDAVNRRVDVTENALLRIAMLMSEQRDVEQAEWTSAVDSSRSDLPGLVQCDIESNGRRSRSPVGGQYLRVSDAAWDMAFVAGSRGRVEAGFVRVSGDPFLYFATFANGSIGHHVRIVAVFEPAAFMEAALPRRTAGQYTCRLLANGEVVYASADLGGTAPWSQFALGPLNAWALHLQPSPDFLNSHRGSVPLTVLLAGIACACLLGLSTHQAAKSRRRAAELRRANVELHDSRANLEQLVASLPEAVLIVAADGRIEKVGGAQLAVLSRPGSTLVGRNIDEVIGLDEGGNTLRNTRRVSGMEGLVGQKVDAVVRGEDGQTTFCVIRISALETPQGRRFLWSVADIQWRKAVEEERARLFQELQKQVEANRDLAARHNALVNCGAIGMGLVDPDGRFLEFNETLAATVGYTREELLRMSVSDLNHPQDQPQASTFIAEMKQGTRDGYHTLKRYLCKDGRAIWVDVTAAALRNARGDLVGIIGIMLDVSARVAASEALEASEQKLQQLNQQLEARNRELQTILEEARESAERFQTLMAAAPEATLLVDQSGRILEFNKRAQELLGYTEAEARAGTVEMLVPPEVRPRHEGIRNEYMIAPEHRMMARGRDLVAIAKDGSRVPVEINLSPLRVRGQVMVAASMVDLRERLRVADELRASERRLRAANKELEGIVYVASHDMRSPLVNLQGFSRQLSTAAEKLAPLLAKLPPEEQARAETVLRQQIPEAVGFISASTRKMDGLIKGLLRLSRLGRAPLQLKQVDMNHLLSETVGATQFVLKERGIAVDVADLPPCWGDETQLGQVFSNLVDNAIKYRDRGKAGFIRVHGRVEGDYALYDVEDNGIGIAPDHQAQVFEIFHRLAPDGDVPGEGLGLSVVRRILDRHDGDIRLQSTPGVGSRFTVILPRFAGARGSTEVAREQPQ